MTTRIEIARGKLACIRNGRGALVWVREGTAWITQSGSPYDVVLEAGESFCIDRNGLTLVTACGPLHHALVVLLPAIQEAPSLAKRFCNLLLGARMPSRPSVRAI